MKTENMFMAFVFLKTETGSETAVMKTLEQIEGVEETYRLNGVCARAQEC